MSKKGASKSSKKERTVNESMPQERAEIIAYLKKLKFRHKFFGGVDERTVWKKIQELDKLYEAALQAERVRYNTLLEVRQTAPQDAEAGGPLLQEGGDPSE